MYNIPICIALFSRVSNSAHELFDFINVQSEQRRMDGMLKYCVIALHCIAVQQYARKTCQKIIHSNQTVK